MEDFSSSVMSHFFPLGVSAKFPRFSGLEFSCFIMKCPLPKNPWAFDGPWEMIHWYEKWWCTDVEDYQRLVLIVCRCWSLVLKMSQILSPSPGQTSGRVGRWVCWQIWVGMGLKRCDVTSLCTWIISHRYLGISYGWLDEPTMLMTEGLNYQVSGEIPSRSRPIRGFQVTVSYTNWSMVSSYQMFTYLDLHTGDHFQTQSQQIHLRSSSSHSNMNPHQDSDMLQTISLW